MAFMRRISRFLSYVLAPLSLSACNAILGIDPEAHVAVDAAVVDANNPPDTGVPPGLDAMPPDVTVDAEPADVRDSGPTDADGGVIDFGPRRYSVRADVSQLQGNGLVLRNNGGDDLTIDGVGVFTFATQLDDGAPYNVTVQNAPIGEACPVMDGIGMIRGANVTVTLVCRSLRIVFEGLRDISGADSRGPGCGSLNVWRAQADGASQTPVTMLVRGNGCPTRRAYELLPRPSPSGNGFPILYKSARKMDRSDSLGPLDSSCGNGPEPAVNGWRVDLDGFNDIAIAPVTDCFDGWTAFPNRALQWSPDGRSIAFTTYRPLSGTGASPSSNIWGVNTTDLQNPSPITRSMVERTNNVDPQWSPDGTKLVFASEKDPDHPDAPQPNRIRNIWVVDVGLTPTPRWLTRVTENYGNCDHPQWSPDGTKIVFESGRSFEQPTAPNPTHTYNLWVMNADGSMQRPLTRLTAATTDTTTQAASIDPRWSPDGRRIVFWSSRALDPARDALNDNNTDNVWIINADGTGAMPLTRGTALHGASADPQWSPDGSWILFWSYLQPDGHTVGTARNLYRVNPDASNFTPLTRNSVAWSYNPQFSR